MSEGVLIVGEVVDGVLHPTVRQLVNAAERIGDEASLCLAVDEAFDDRALEGVNVGNVTLLEHPDAAADGIGGVYSLLTELVCEAVERLDPSVILVAKTDAGSVVSARLAARFATGLASDCIDLALNADGRGGGYSTQCMEGALLAVYEFTGEGMQVVSVRPGAFEAIRTLATRNAGSGTSRRLRRQCCRCSPRFDGNRRRRERRNSSRAGRHRSVWGQRPGRNGTVRRPPRAVPTARVQLWARPELPATLVGSIIRTKLASPAKTSVQRPTSPWVYPVPANTWQDVPQRATSSQSTKTRKPISSPTPVTAWSVIGPKCYRRSPPR